MAVKRITKRWLTNSFLVILTLLSAVIIGSSIFIRSYFYNNALQIIRSNATVNDTLLVNYSGLDENELWRLQQVQLDP